MLPRLKIRRRRASRKRKSPQASSAPLRTSAGAIFSRHPSTGSSASGNVATAMTTATEKRDGPSRGKPYAKHTAWFDVPKQLSPQASSAPLRASAGATLSRHPSTGSSASGNVATATTTATEKRDGPSRGRPYEDPLPPPKNLSKTVRLLRVIVPMAAIPILFRNTSAAIVAFFEAVLLYTIYALWVFRKWERSFAGHRLHRDIKPCPSNAELPSVLSLEGSKSLILKRASSHVLEEDDLLRSVSERKRSHRGGSRRLHRERSRRTGFLAPSVSATNLARLHSSEEPVPSRESGSSLRRSSLSAEEARGLNMDHVHVKFADFLWAYTFIGPLVVLLAQRGTLLLRWRMFLLKKGLIRVACDYEAIAAALVLEQSHAIHYFGRMSESGNLAGFFFPDFPWVDEECNFRIADMFAVQIDLDPKKLKKATLNSKTLTAKETVTLLWFNTIGAQHVKLHAMANWGINVDDSLEDFNSFLRRNSVTTAMYNYFGYSLFPESLEAWANQGLLHRGWLGSHAPLTACFDHGINSTLLEHGHVKELVKYSRLVNFTVKVRVIFLSEFKKYKHLFPGVDGEALFVGTVLHSLDHTLADWNLRDPLYLDPENNRFSRMTEVGRIAKVGFVADLNGVYFHKRFKGSGHPFYDAVYKKAARVDKELADHMNTCIIK